MVGSKKDGGRRNKTRSEQLHGELEDGRRDGGKADSEETLCRETNETHFKSVLAASLHPPVLLHTTSPSGGTEVKVMTELKPKPEPSQLYYICSETIS